MVDLFDDEAAAGCEEAAYRNAPDVEVGIVAWHRCRATPVVDQLTQVP
jgi:hypothetical protein